MKFDNMVSLQDEIDAHSLEKFSFAIPDVIEDPDISSDDDFEDPPGWNHVPKTVSPPQHRSKFGQHSRSSLKSLSDHVDVIATNEQFLALNQFKIMQLMNTMNDEMKNEMSSNFVAIMAILSVLKGSRIG